MAILSKSNFTRLFEFRFDAECYQPQFLEAERQIAWLKPRALDAVADVSDGNHMSVADDFCDAGVRYLKGAELSDFFIDDSAPTYVPAEVHAEMTRAQVKQGDVLVSVIGTVGPVALVTDKYERLSCSCKLAILRPRAVNSACLAIYLTSEIGQRLIQRRMRGSVQQGIILPDLRKFPVPTFSERLVTEVERVVGAAHRAAQQAVALYPEAEAELLDRLGWAGVAEQPRELSYSAEFSAMKAAGRSDAEFFQPHCLRLRERIRKAGDKRIGEFCPEPSRGVQPEFSASGTVLTLDSKSIRPHGVEPSGERVTQAFYDSEFAAKGRVCKGDVLLNSTGRGTLGRAGCYQLDAPAVCDNHVAILRPDPKVCHLRYLALFLNSPAGLTQSEQFQTGSSGQLEIYPQHIQQFLIYLPRTKAGGIDLAWQEKLAVKVETATRAREEAKTKLAEAKRLVEEAIKQT